MRAWLLPWVTVLCLPALAVDARAATCEARPYDVRFPLRNELRDCLASASAGDTVVLQDGVHRALNETVPSGVTVQAKSGASPVVRFRSPTLGTILAALANLGRSYLLDGFDLFVVQDADRPVVFDGITFEPLSGSWGESEALTIGRSVSVHDSEVLFVDCRLVPFDRDDDDGSTDKSEIRLYDATPDDTALDRTGGVFAAITGASLVTLRDVTITGVRGRWVDGAAVIAQGAAAQVRIEGGTFQDATSASGLIAVDSGAKLVIAESPEGSTPIFQRIYGLYGSAFHVGAASVGVVEAGSFLDNGVRPVGSLEVRGNFGGHGAVSGGGLLTISGGSFQRGRAAVGGALAAVNARLQVTGGTFGGAGDGHEARLGGILAALTADAEPGPPAELDVRGVTLGNGVASLTDNERATGEPELAPAGGAVFASGAEVVLDGVIIRNNAVADEGLGGGIGLQGGSLLAAGLELSDNTAWGGAGLAAAGSSVQLTRSDIVGNGRRGETWSGGGILALDSDVEVEGGRIADNAADFGGGVGAWGDGSLSLLDVSTVQNRAVYGGGVGGVVAQVTLEQGEVARNDASSEGGGVLLLGVWPDPDVATFGTALIEGTSIVDNVAENGAGVMLNEVQTELRGVEVARNTAIGLGGGLMHEYSDLTVVDSALHANSADVAGGGLWSVGGTLTLLGSTLRGNKAPDGSALAVLDSFGHTLVRNRICGNPAFESASMVFTAPDGSDVPPDQATVFRNNLVDGEGVEQSATLVLGTGRYAIDHNHFVRGTGVAVVASEGTVAFDRNAVAFYESSPLLVGADGAQVRLQRNVFWGSEGPIEAIGEDVGSGATLGPADVFAMADPRLRGFVAGKTAGPCSLPDHHPRPDSPLIDAYDGFDTDPAADHIGLYGGPSAPQQDWTTNVDGDDAMAIFDCDETDDTVGDRLVQYRDNDGDGLGGLVSEGYDCVLMPGHVLLGGDCDDNDEGIGLDCPGGGPTFYGTACDTGGASGSGVVGLAGLLLLLLRRRRHRLALHS